MYRIMMVSMGGTRRPMYSGLTEAEAEEICEGYGWEVSPEGSYVWDLEIEEDYDEE